MANKLEITNVKRFTIQVPRGTGIGCRDTQHGDAQHNNIQRIVILYSINGNVALSITTTLGITTLRITTLSITTLNIKTSITTPSITTLSVTKLSITTLSITKFSIYFDPLSLR
jgi:hypothetical protein